MNEKQYIIVKKDKNSYFPFFHKIGTVDGIKVEQWCLNIENACKLKFCSQKTSLGNMIFEDSQGNRITTSDNSEEVFEIKVSFGPKFDVSKS